MANSIWTDWLLQDTEGYVSTKVLEAVFWLRAVLFTIRLHSLTCVLLALLHQFITAFMVVTVGWLLVLLLVPAHSIRLTIWWRRSRIESWQMMVRPWKTESYWTQSLYRGSSRRFTVYCSGSIVLYSTLEVDSWFHVTETMICDWTMRPVTWPIQLVSEWGTCLLYVYYGVRCLCNGNKKSVLDSTWNQNTISYKLICS